MKDTFKQSAFFPQFYQSSFLSTCRSQPPHGLPDPSTGLGAANVCELERCRADDVLLPMLLSGGSEPSSMSIFTTQLLTDVHPFILHAARVRPRACIPHFVAAGRQGPSTRLAFMNVCLPSRSCLSLELLNCFSLALEQRVGLQPSLRCTHHAVLARSIDSGPHPAIFCSATGMTHKQQTAEHCAGFIRPCIPEAFFWQVWSGECPGTQSVLHCFLTGFQDTVVGGPFPVSVSKPFHLE